MSSVGIKIALGVIKVLVTAYDVVTLPVYFVIQKPWVYWRRKRQCFARAVIEGDPSSPYKRQQVPECSSLEGIDTLAEATRRAIRLYPKLPSLGTRPVLSRTEVKQATGKVVKKLVLGDYEWLTFEEVDRKIDATARGLLSIGAKPGHFLAIFAETRVEWFLTAQACFRTNTPVVTLYVTLSNDALVSAVNETEVTHLVTSAELLPRLLSLVKNMPSLTHIVYMEDDNSGVAAPTIEGPQVIPFRSLEHRGARCETATSAPTPDDVAIVMFTSGSTGKPKGVIATHRNLITSMKGDATIIETSGERPTEHTYIAYLPLAHMLELTVEAVFFAAGVRIGYSSPQTLTANLEALAPGCPGDITLLQPTVIACVPLVADRIRQTVYESAASKGLFFKTLLDYSITYKNFWLDLGFRTPLLNRLIFNKIRSILGGKLKFLASSAAPLSIQTRRFVRASLSVQILDGYGLTESGGAATLMSTDDMSEGRVGAPLPGCYIRLVDWPEGNYGIKDKPNPRGEIVVGGPCVTKGYFKNDELTRECYREESGIRWFYTGDIGEIFPDGTLKIIDRKKDLIKLQFGEYIALGHVEAILKTCPLVDNAFTYGSTLHTYLVALVTPNEKQFRRLARDLGKNASATLEELCGDFDITDAAAKAIMSHAADNGLQKSEVPRKVKICAEQWNPESGLVTPTLKIRRKFLQNFYQQDINLLYGI
ncbi:hypothetical protein HPB48_012546 [Haemaphysalis longicornis]|uniref:long-chain-fatty-acid--CoA ligase n=1 Tax=Haemaphysalis longicornis TaxID=44386 RepID=A0A9J6GKY9_HAELO|nr:hypothetical protein HPB48_012546 [Haemaphysalis longicornis]